MSRRFTCSRCGVGHSRFRDKRRTQPASYCRKCHAIAMREVRQRYLENIVTLISVLCPECQELIRAKLATTKGRKNVPRET